MRSANKINICLLANPSSWRKSYLWPSRIDIAIFGVWTSSDDPKHKDNLHVDGEGDGDIGGGSIRRS